MGGAVSALFLEKYKTYFDEAVFSSPMLAMKAKTYPEPVLKVISAYGHLTGKLRQMAPGQKHWDGVNIFESSSTLSRSRYDYLFDQRIEDVRYQTYGASLGWGIASMRATRRLMKNAYKVDIPVTIMSAGRDHLVDQEGYGEFASRAANVTIYEFPESKHEIFNADDDTRGRYYKQIFDILQ